MLDTALSIPFWLELSATLIGAFSGAMAGMRARYDILGICVVAIVTGMAGGVLRDILLQHYGIYALQKPSLLIGCCIIGLIVFFFGRLATSLSSYLHFAFDALDNTALALWGIIGTAKALSAGLMPVSAVILGTITAAGGGVARDILMNYEPDAFKAGNFYVMAAVVGCSIFCIMKRNVYTVEYAGTVGVVIILSIRYAALFFNWRTTPPIDLSDKVEHFGRKIQRPMKSFLDRAQAPTGKVRRDRESAALGYAAFIQEVKDFIPSSPSKEESKPVVDTDHITLQGGDWRRLKADMNRLRSRKP